MNTTKRVCLFGPARYWIVLSAGLVTTTFANAQTTLSLASGSAPLGSVALDLSLKNASAGPSGLQWTVSYPSDLVSLSTATGPALAAAGKSLSCNSKTGSVTCLATGMNSTTIGNGVIATLTAKLSSINVGWIPLPISSVMGADPDGTPSPLVGANGGVAGILSGLTDPITVTALQCSPSTVMAGGSSNCTVTILRPAPAGGIEVVLSDDSSALTRPSSVTVPAGATTVSFAATGLPVTSNQQATITATLNGSSITESLTVTPSRSRQTEELGPSAAYSFDEGIGPTVYDASGNDNSGYVHYYTWSPGRYGTAMYFNGMSYVALGNPPALQTGGSTTWTAWVKPTDHPWDDGQIVAQSNGFAGFELKTSPDTGVRTFGVAVGGGGGLSQRYSRTRPELDTWYHVAGVYNASSRTLDIYVNGVPDNGALRGTVPSFRIQAPGEVTIGMRSSGFNFIGVIDNLRIYNRPLTAAEIQTDMNTPIF